MVLGGSGRKTDRPTDCPRFPTAASNGSSGHVSVPVWLIIKKDTSYSSSELILYFDRPSHSVASDSIFKYNSFPFSSM